MQPKVNSSGRKQIQPRLLKATKDKMNTMKGEKYLMDRQRIMIFSVLKIQKRQQLSSFCLTPHDIQGLTLPSGE